MRRYFWILLGVVALIVILFGSALVTLYTDWLWFTDLGYASIFTKIIWTRIGLSVFFGALFFVIVYGNLLIVRRLAPPPTRRYEGIEDELRERLGSLARRGLGVMLFAATLVIAIFVGLQAGTHWDDWLRVQNAVLFDRSDPIFGANIGFYVFRLPFWNYLYAWFFGAILTAVAASAILHYADEGIDFIANTPRFAPGVKAHLAVLLSLLFFLKAIGYRLAMYGLVKADNGFFTGAGYTDVHARIPMLWLLIFAAVAGGLVVLVNIFRRGIYYAAGAFVGLIALSILAGAGYPALVDQFIVKPNALDKQRRYIVSAIDYTRQAFRLGKDVIASREFPYVPTLTADQIAGNRAAVQNMRLWDYGPLKRTYQQLQELQQYYNFNDVDIDRYTIGGVFRQVMLSARELPGPPQNAQSWINQRLRYTHGYGYVMSPVNEVTAEGLPVFFASGIPTILTNGLKLDVPQVYFGELTNDYVLVNTRQKEFDHPGPSGDVETTYRASNGPAIGSFLRKLAFALRFGEINILLSGDLRPSSRVLFRRNIADRVRTLFPFLTFDRDPYLVTVGGKLYWFHDAYTTTTEYPYSEPIGDGNANYIRNSVKLITDAYTGKVRAFVYDPTDPIIETYGRIFPGVFEPLERMPAEFRAHIRYPEDLFTIQAQVYSKYHMTNPSTFFSSTDLWRIPQLPGEVEGQTSQIEPYYVITRLPNAPTEEFLLIAPFVRADRENMVAWMAARCGPVNYGRLILYQFPRGELVFGPSQIMSRANVDPQISQEFTLWGQIKSSVVRGNLLAIPIESSILYVEPIYLESTTTKIPEFKRVIVAMGSRLTMQPTLEEALAQVTGVANLPQIAALIRPSAGAGRPAGVPPPRAAPVPLAVSPAVSDLARRAAEQFDRAQQAQRQGDWTTYGKELDALKKTLDELQKRAGR